MKKVLIFSLFVTFMLFLSSCSTSTSEQASSQYEEESSVSPLFSASEIQPDNEDISDNEESEESLPAPTSEEQPDSEGIAQPSTEADVNKDEDKSSDTQTISNKLAKSPDGLSLMSYAQTVLKDFFPECKYSRDERDYNFIQTNLRFKIEGKVSVNPSSSPQDFWMIIQFLDDNYETYDLVSLQVGKDVVYKSNTPTTAPSSSAVNENDILSKENQALFNEVMNKLNAEYDRDENVVFEEIAPNYGMTGSELQKFMRDYMEAYYQ